MRCRRTLPGEVLLIVNQMAVDMTAKNTLPPASEQDLAVPVPGAPKPLPPVAPGRCPTCGRGHPNGPTLPPRRRRFVVEYLLDPNATQAAIRAGYAPGSAKVTGSRLLTNANVAAAIEDARGLLTERTQLAAEWAIRKLAENGLAAMEQGAYGPANRAFELVGQHFGAFPAPKALPPPVPGEPSAHGVKAFELRVIYDDDLPEERVAAHGRESEVEC